MMISPFFQDLRSAYQAEMEDLTFDSEGHDVLSQRLADKRKEVGFLVSMMEFNPEMVAVIFHRGFAFGQPAVMDDLLGLESDDFPGWSSLAHAVQLAPWAKGLAETVLKEPRGEWFMTVAAGLEYMAGKPALARAGDDADEDDADGEDEFDDETDGLTADDQQGDARERREAGDEWMAGQGFDPKA